MSRVLVLALTPILYLIPYLVPIFDSVFGSYILFSVLIHILFSVLVQILFSVLIQILFSEFELFFKTVLGPLTTILLAE